MSNVKNDPKYKNPLLQAVRAQLEHRAFWLYLLCDEAQKRGLDPRDFGSAAVRRCGLSQGADLVKKGSTDSLKGLRKTLFTKAAQLGVGIELNQGDMSFADNEADIVLRMFRIARNCGCKFYLGSDAHHPDDFKGTKDVFERTVTLLGLTENDKFRIGG